jgi:hypothetical protein
MNLIIFHFATAEVVQTEINYVSVIKSYFVPCYSLLKLLYFDYGLVVFMVLYLSLVTT